MTAVLDAEAGADAVADRRDGRARSRLIVASLAAVVVVLMVASLGLGRYPVALGTVGRLLAALAAGRDLADGRGAWTATEAIVVATVRLPRVLVAALAGAGLGLAGATVQGVFRNPLAGPQVLGISHGAAWGGVLAILLGAGAAPTVALAFVFALAALALAFLLDRLSGAASTLSLVLAGVVVSAFFAALVGLAEFLADADRQLPGIVYWLLGSFATASARSAWIIGVPTVVGGGLLLALRWRINVLSLGDGDAQALGVRVGPLRWGVLALVTLVVAAQVAVSGAIGWVGLVVPHLARRLVGPNHQHLLPASALLGSAYLLAIDDVARTVAAQEIPIGVLTALLGTPLFAVVYWRSRSAGWSRG